MGTLYEPTETQKRWQDIDAICVKAMPTELRNVTIRRIGVHKHIKQSAGLNRCDRVGPV